MTEQAKPVEPHPNAALNLPIPPQEFAGDPLASIDAETAAELKKAADEVMSTRAKRGFFDAVYQQHTRTGADAFTDAPLLPRRRYKFDLDTSEALPGIFVDGDGNPVILEVTVCSLTSGEELEALAGLKNPAEAQLRLTRRSIESVSGTELDDDKRAFFWEAIGPAGRAVVTIAFSRCGTPGASTLGKFQASFSNA